MGSMTLQTLGRKLADKRKSRGIRETAREIGISAATLSRMENGHLPDLETFGKVCRWLQIDPGVVLGVPFGRAGIPQVGVHFKKDHAIPPQTAQALAQMILDAQRAYQLTEYSDEHA